VTDQERLQDLIEQGSMIRLTDPASVFVQIAYCEIWPERDTLFFCVAGESGSGSPSGGPHRQHFTRMVAQPTRVNFYASDQLVATVAAFDEWPELEAIVGLYKADWRRWKADSQKKKEAEEYWSEDYGKAWRAEVNT
jgi:hypothetical protein